MANDEQDAAVRGGASPSKPDDLAKSGPHAAMPRASQAPPPRPSTGQFQLQAGAQVNSDGSQQSALSIHASNLPKAAELRELEQLHPGFVEIARRSLELANEHSAAQIAISLRQMTLDEKRVAIFEQEQSEQRGLRVEVFREQTAHQKERDAEETRRWNRRYWASVAATFALLLIMAYGFRTQQGGSAALLAGAIAGSALGGFGIARLATKKAKASKDDHEDA